MRKLPPLSALRAFEAAARHRSFRSAAVELGVTPTAISHQIRLLEAFCGGALFRRQPRPVTLTAAGQHVFPVLRDGFNSFADAIDRVRSGETSPLLRVTATNAFAARWLVPRLPAWRAVYPNLALDIIGTDTVLSLDNGEADIAIRYARSVPSAGYAVELARDKFLVVAAPSLVRRSRKSLSPLALSNLPLIETGWPADDDDAPTWRRWEQAAREVHRHVPLLHGSICLHFREELHAIEAAISGQGLAICSDVLIAPELKSGILRKVAEVTLPGYGFYIVSRPRPSKSVETFVAWARGVV